MSIHTSDSEVDIKRLEDDLVEAMRLNSLAFLEQLFSEKYIFLGSDGSTWGKAKALDDFKHPRFQSAKIEVYDRRITMHDGCAIVTGTSVVEGRIGEASLAGRYRFMRVWHKGANGWEIIAIGTNKAG